LRNRSTIGQLTPQGGHDLGIGGALVGFQQHLRPFHIASAHFALARQRPQFSFFVLIGPTAALPRAKERRTREG
jgi:hypothetical protein